MPFTSGSLSRLLDLSLYCGGRYYFRSSGALVASLTIVDVVVALVTLSFMQTLCLGFSSIYILLHVLHPFGYFLSWGHSKYHSKYFPSNNDFHVCVYIIYIDFRFTTISLISNMHW